MKKHNTRRFYMSILIWFILATTFNPINSSQNQPLSQDYEIIAIYGTVTYIDLEGGFYGIVSSNGNFDPLNLPIEYQQNGLPVYVEAYIRNDLISIHMWGVIIEIIEIQSTAPSEPIYEFGDVNDDGSINIVDALMTAQYSVGLNIPNFYGQVADVNLDGNINIVDALTIVQYSVGNLDTMPCHDLPLIEGTWSLSYYDWQDNLTRQEYVEIMRSGNEISIFSITNNEALGTGKLIVNNLAPPNNLKSEYIIQGIDLRNLGIYNIFVSNINNMETELPMAKSFNPCIFSRVRSFLGEFQMIPNPTISNPSWPGLIDGIIEDKEYILTLEGQWILSETPVDWPGYDPNYGDLVEIIGYETIQMDLFDQPYYEIEVSQIEPAIGLYNIDMTHNDTLQEVVQDSFIKIVLIENPSTGYQWFYTLPNAITLISDIFVPPEEPLPGSPGIRIITLKVTSQTDFRIEALYVRPWENIPGQIFTVDFSPI